jgi:hypothetical protein
MAPQRGRRRDSPPTRKKEGQPTTRKKEKEGQPTTRKKEKEGRPPTRKEEGWPATSMSDGFRSSSGG